MNNERITTCNICGATVRKAHEVLFKELTGLGDWKEEVAICDSCGFIFAANPFTEDMLADRYKNLSKYEFDSGDYQIGADVPYMKRCKRQFDFILENVDAFDSILEVGAASGYNLSLYKDEQKIGHSVRVMGIEPSGVNCKLAQKNYDIQLFNGLFSEYIDKNSSQKFDLIFFSHVLEHIVNPRDFIEQCKTMNNKYIFIEVPTFDYKFENEFLGMFSDEHINYFTFESLSNLMNSCGYTIVEAEIPLGIQVKIAAGVPALATLWALADEQTTNNNTSIYKPVSSSGVLLENYMHSNAQTISRIKKLIDSISPSTRLAVWGTGNHTSRLLGATSLAEKNIIKFYDSDNKKYNYRILGKKVEKFEPYDVESGAVEAILISAYAAQDAIKAAIEKANVDVEIITLY